VAIEVVGIKVEYELPDPGLLAMKLVEAFRAVEAHKRDVASFAQQSQSERIKVQQLRNLILQVREYQRNPPERRRRMEPLADHNLQTLKEEMEEARRRMVEFQATSDEQAREASRRHEETIKLQGEISRVNSALKKRAAGG
jgi:hypothetical protein